LCHTYRYHGHHVGDINREYYRSKEEEAHWRTERDPLKLLSAWLMAEELAEAAMFEQIEKEVEAEVKAGAEFALKAPYPDEAEVRQHVYA
jgi:pyruvate dehydrogenase E1 component alpha subunit